MTSVLYLTSSTDVVDSTTADLIGTKHYAYLKLLEDTFGAGNVTRQFSDNCLYTENTILNFLGEVENDDDVVIFTTEKVTSILPSADLEDLINTVREVLITENVEDRVDMYHLFDSLDSCMILEDIFPQDADILIRHVKTKTPNGLHFIVSTKAGWANILNSLSSDDTYLTSKITEAVVSELISSGTTYPRAIVWNLDFSGDSLDLFYTQPCRIEKDYGRVIPNRENTIFYWFVVGMVLVLLILWWTTSFAPRKRLFYVKDMPEGGIGIDTY